MMWSTILKKEKLNLTMKALELKLFTDADLTEQVG